MKSSVSVLFLIALVLGFFIAAQANLASCAGCTIVASVLEQLNNAHSDTNIEGSLKIWCKAFSGTQTWLNDVCVSLFGLIVPAIQADYDKNVTPDETCRKLNLCTGDDVKCTLWPRGASADGTNTSPCQNTFAEQVSPYANVDISQIAATFEDEENLFAYVFHAMKNWSKPDAIKPIENYSGIKKYLKSHPHIKINTDFAEQASQLKKGLLPATGDDDEDGSATFAQLRGFDWRGKDCDDTNGDVYPGRGLANSDPKVDHDCNGISGVSPSGKSYEDLYCSSTKTFEYIALGDSATAHFSLNPKWINGASIVDGVYDSLIPNVMNEMDFPMCSLVTGWDKTQCPSLDESFGPFTSIYDYARSKNACAHRQYRSISKNGARAENFAPSSPDGYMNSLIRDPVKDKPAAVFFSLIGNDVCNRLVPVNDYHDWMVESLQQLDKTLTPGSHVFVGGLVNGSLLYENMYNRIHPLGTHYWAFYDYLNCFDANPCQNWLTSNESQRRATTSHARKLSASLKSIVDGMKFQNYKIHYLDYEGTLDKIIASLRARGFDIAKLIEPFDGFHPSSTANSLLAQAFIQQIESSPENGSEIFKANPNQASIFATFGANLNGY